MRIGTTFTLVLLVVLPSALLGQGISSSSINSGPGGQFTAKINLSPPPFALPAVSGAPYSAAEISEATQTLTDGTKISRSMATTYTYRDSAGRTRMERPFVVAPMGGQVPADLPNVIEINDSIAGYWIVLDSINKTAHRYQLQSRPGLSSTSFSRVTGGIVGGTDVSGGVSSTGTQPAAMMRPQISSESLGTKTIDGVLVLGTLMKMTYPAGMMGNDKPIVTTTESWHSPELKVTVMSRTSDPRSGETIRGLTNINRAEPNPALFQIPRDYRVVDETGPVTLTITRP